MTVQPYEQVIVEGLRGLPQESLVEIADFIYFVRKRVLNEESIEDELFAALIHAELTQLNQESEQHLEEEFADYDKRYPDK